MQWEARLIQKNADVSVETNGCRVYILADVAAMYISKCCVSYFAAFAYKYNVGEVFV
jgi:hypothetical protein